MNLKVVRLLNLTPDGLTVTKGQKMLSTLHLFSYILHANILLRELLRTQKKVILHNNVIMVNQRSTVSVLMKRETEEKSSTIQSKTKTAFDTSRICIRIQLDSLTTKEQTTKQFRLQNFKTKIYI